MVLSTRPFAVIFALTLMSSPSLAQFGGFDANDIGGLANAAKGLAEQHGIEGLDGLIDSAARAAQNYDGDLFADLQGIAASLGIDLSKAVELLSTQKQVNSASTGVIRNVIDETNDDCQKLPQTYRIICLQKGFDVLGRALPKRGDYADVRAALKTVSTELNKIARSNRDRSQGRVKLGKERGARVYSATKGGAALEQARAALERAQAQLLRSAPPGDPRRAHFQRIAAAFDESAVLLRS